MSVLSDIKFCLRPSCPACGEGRLYKPFSLIVVDVCDGCQIKLGRHDIGDGAAVFMIFLLGFTLVPMAWFFELSFRPALWVHGVLWGSVALAFILLILPGIKAFILLLEYRHRPELFKK